MGRDAEYLAFVRLLAKSDAANPPRDLEEERVAVAASLSRLPKAAVAHVEDLELGGVPARLYHPAPGRTLPGLVFFHGGGFALGSVAGYDAIVRMMVDGIGCAIVSVDYRLAPEHPFPAAVEDAYAATTSVLAQAGDLGIGRLGAAGDSSGGNLAAVTTQRLRAELAAQVLLYGVYDLSEHLVVPPDPDGLRLDDGGWPETRDRYLDGADPTQPYASPLLVEDLTGLPPTVLLRAEYDKLHDQGGRYAERLRAAGVSVTVVEGSGLDHAFLAWTPFARRPAEAVAELCAAVRAALRVGQAI